MLAPGQPMELSTFFDADSVVGQHPLAWVAIVFALGATAILIWYLVRRPPLDRRTKLWLLFGIGVFPISAAGAGNIAEFSHTTKIHFCAGCHVMTPYTNDARDPNSTSLASRHSRNVWFGDTSCYTCHSDYGMFGTVTTKLAGVHHLYEYYQEYSDLSIEEALPRIHLYSPFPNATCMRCHTTLLPGWNETPEHVAMTREVRDGLVSCASAGCHGPAHPFSKTEEEVPQW